MNKEQLLKLLDEKSAEWYAVYEHAAKYDGHESPYAQRALGHSRGYEGAIALINQLEE